MALTTLSVLAPTAALAAPEEPAYPQVVGPGTLSLTFTSPAGVEDQQGGMAVFRWNEQEDRFDYHDHYEITVPGRTANQLPVGRYYYETYTWSDDFTGGYSGEVQQPPAHADDPGAFEITADETVEHTVEFVHTAKFIGSVVLPAGREAWSFQLRIRDSASEYSDEVPINADGTFAHLMWWGSYDVSLIDIQQEYRAHSFGTLTFERGRNIEVPPVTLQPGRTNAVKGRVLVGGSPKAGVSVTAFYRVKDERGDSFYAGDESTVTDAEGNYTLHTLRETREYSLVIEGDGVRTTYLGGSADEWWEGETFVPSTDPTILDDILVDRLPVVSGHVTGPDGRRLAGDVAAHLVHDEDSLQTFSPRVIEHPDDGFRLTVEPGEYVLEASTWGNNNLTARSGYFGTQFADDWEEAGTVSVVDEDIELNIELPHLETATGTVSGPSGPLMNAEVTAYSWNEDWEGWAWENEALTREDGSWNMRLRDGVPHFLQVKRNGYVTWLGGDRDTPPVFSDPALFVPEGDGFDTGAVTLTPRDSDLGTTAGENLPWCETSALFPDESAKKILLPFEINFLGSKTRALYIQQFGAVSFQRNPEIPERNPFESYRGKPFFAPFLASMSRDYTDAGQLTYGISPDNTQFCVTWHEQTPNTQDDYTSNTHGQNTFQMILTDTSAAPGRSSGDFDVRYNYDVIDWDGSGAWDDVDGDEPSWIGYAQGTQKPGTSFTLPGSGELGAFVDGGSAALTEGSHRSAQVGRYRFEFRNSDAPSAAPVGELRGTVVDSSDTPVAMAQVRVCLDGGTWCDYTFTRANGSYAVSGAPVGTYTVVATRGLATLTGDVIPGSASAIVNTGAATVVPTISLGVAAAPVVPLSINGEETTEVPVLDLRAPTTITFTGCEHVTDPTMSLVGEFGQTVLTSPLTESPDGTYSATFTPNAIASYATFITNVPATCGGSPITFTVYIDPAGVVSDQYGRVIKDAEVTLLRADAEGDAYTVVPDGSAVMSPRNRSNPSLTDSTGYFAWDVTAGWYKVKAEASGCTTRTTDGLEVPPERLSLHIALTCDVAAPAPSTKPTLTGTGVEGTELVATAAVWAAPFAQASFEWLRDGVVDTSITGLRHTVRASDVGSVFTVRSVARRPSVTTDGGTSSDLDRLVSFAEVNSVSTAITATAAPKVEPTPGPSPSPSASASPSPSPSASASPSVNPSASASPSASATAKPTAKAKATVTVKVPSSVKAKARAKATITVTAKGTKASKVNGKVILTVSAPGTKTRTITVKVKNGKATVKLPAYAKGKVTVRATWNGTSKIARATATKKVVKVKAAKRR